MITTKNNFKGYLRRRYPKIIAIPIYGLPVYILDQPLSPEDMYLYNIQPLTNGKYAAFIGVTIPEATKLLEGINSGKITQTNKTREKETAPTTFSCFEAWLERHQIKWINRTFCNNMSPEECLQSNHIESCSAPQVKGTWYMYELPGYVNDGKTLANIPNITVGYGPERDVIICLIKASSSKYKSKKQRFIEKFQFMQPIYDQILIACAKEEWDKAETLCNQYMAIQFDRTGMVDKDSMTEAYKNGTIGLFLRNPDNLREDDFDAFTMEGNDEVLQATPISDKEG